MSTPDYYEIVRQKLKVGAVNTPKHDLFIRLMKIFWDEDTIRILSYFPQGGQRITVKDLVEKSGMEKKVIRRLLKSAARKKTINREIGKGYCLEPLLPGVFEAYFISMEDSEENLKKAAKLYREIFKDEEIAHQVFDEGFQFFRPLLPIKKSKQDLIEINHEFDVESQVLSYEMVEDIIENNDHFAVIPCQCRLVGEMSGEPCNVASSEMGCLSCGIGAQMLAMSGKAKSLTKKEAIEFLKETEKAGLVHSTSNSKGGEHLHFICNCCTCHCGVLKHVKDFGTHSLNPSNYKPIFNDDGCIECGICVEKCPMDAISTRDDGKIEFNKEICIGCGICANNCSTESIKMMKMHLKEPPEKNKVGGKYFMQILGELLNS